MDKNLRWRLELCIAQTRFHGARERAQQPGGHNGRGKRETQGHRRHQYHRPSQHGEESGTGLGRRRPDVRRGSPGRRHPAQADARRREEFVAWIGKDHGLIYRYSTYGSYPACGDLKAYVYWQTVTFSDFNDPFDIPSATDTGTGSADDGDDGADPTAVLTPLPTTSSNPTVEPTPERKDAPSK